MLHRAARLDSAPASILDGEFTAIIASGRRDLFGDELDLDGADLDDYLSGNPVLLDGHGGEAIGRALSIDRIGDKLVARFKLLSAGVSAAADAIRAKIAEKVASAVSIGFEPLEFAQLPSAGRRFTRWRLAEISVVPLGANPDAVILSRAAPDPREVFAMPEAVAPVVDPAAIAAHVVSVPNVTPQTVPVSASPRSLGAHVAASDLLTRAAKSGTAREDFRMSLLTRAAPILGTPAIGANGVPVATPAAYVGPFGNYGSPARLIDALQVIPVSGGTILYAVLTPDGNSAAIVPEATAKPAQSFSVQDVTAEVPTVAATVRVSKQLLADAPAIVQMLDGVMTSLLLDKADAEAFGRLTTAGAYTAWSGAVSGDSTFDGIARIVSALQVAGAKQITVAVSPADALAMQLAKATGSGVYLLPPTINANVIAVPVVPQGQVLAFDASAVALAVREQVTVEVGLSDDDWVKNLRTLLAEARMLAISQKPALVMYGPLRTVTEGGA